MPIVINKLCLLFYETISIIKKNMDITLVK